MPTERYDLIVAGTGAVGSAALWQAALRGLRVLGIDRFPPGHDHGSSHGRTRIIRQAYFEHPDYVPLLLRAYELWHELEHACGEQLLRQTGLLQVGPADGFVVNGVVDSAKRHGLQVETYSADDCQQRFPAFRIPPDQVAVFEPKAGFLHVERCVIAQADEAQRLGAVLRVGETVQGFRQDGDHVVVTTDKQEYIATRLVVTAGAWAGQWLAELGVPLTVRRKPVYWFEPQDDRFEADQGCPAYLFETPAGVFYGFPRIDEHGVKVAEHTGGETVADPLTVDRGDRVADREPLLRFTAAHLPGLTDRILGHNVCLYTMSPDEHFIVDRHPELPAVAFAAGLSGHGFKFAPVLGQALVELAIGGQSRLPVDFLSLSRWR
jgi:sarcosine oxidase